MFQVPVKRSRLRSALQILYLIFLMAARQARSGERNAVFGLVMSIIQLLVMILIFYFMSYLMGFTTSAIRGDLFVFMMSGVAMFMTHVKTMGAVAGAGTPVTGILVQGPTNSIVSIAAAALGTLYMQVLAIGVILYFYHALYGTVTIHDPVNAAKMFLLTWFYGVATGMVMMAITPWAPKPVSIITTIYQRANIIASGKMFLANAMPTAVLAYFDWNPLFHIIDQARGFIFLNYHPHYSSVSYPVKVSIVVVFIGLMAQYYTRKHALSS